MANGVVIPNSKADWISVVDSADYTLKYKVVSGIVYVFLSVNRASAISTSWGGVGTIPVGPNEYIYHCPYATNEGYYMAVSIAANGLVQVKGNSALSTMLSYPL